MWARCRRMEDTENMIIVCSKCGEKFESLIVDRDLALKELEGASSRHVHKKHRELYEQVAKAIAICSVSIARVVHMTECMVVPEEETYIQEKIDEAQEIVMIAVGFDPEEEEEEEDDLVTDEPDEGPGYDPELEEEIEDEKAS